MGVVPIKWLDADGCEISDREVGNPCVRVNVGPATTEPNALGFEGWALIDTGAERTLIEESIPIRLRLSPAGNTWSHGNMGSKPMNLYMINMIVHGIDMAFELNPGTVPLPQMACPFHVVIGRDLLQHCRLTMHGHSEDTLSFPLRDSD